MPEYRTRGLVLRTFDQGESDRLVHLYSEAAGRISAIAKGARRSRRRFPGTLELFSLIDVRLVDPPRSSLMRLESAVLERSFEGLTRHLGSYAIACQLLEILDRFTGEREANPELFQFAEGVLGVLEEEPPDRLLALLVVTKTLSRLGYRPQLLDCAVCGEPPVAFAPRDGGAVCAHHALGEDGRVAPGLLRALEAGIRTPLRARQGLGLDARAVAEAERLMERFFHFHVGFELRTAPFVRDFVPRGLLDAPVARGDTAPAPAGPGAGVRSTV